MFCKNAEKNGLAEASKGSVISKRMMVINVVTIILPKLRLVYFTGILNVYGKLFLVAKVLIKTRKGDSNRLNTPYSFNKGRTNKDPKNIRKSISINWRNSFALYNVKNERIRITP